MSLVQPTRILLVGGGGREHALAWKLAAEPGVNNVLVAPGSDGIAEEDRVTVLPAVDPLDPTAVVAAARAAAAELVVVGPEAPLAAGVADALADAGIPVFGPTAAAARIESSKAFCRDVAEAAGVRVARGRAFEEPDGALAYARALCGDEATGDAPAGEAAAGDAPAGEAAAGDAPAGGRGVVVKADGLASGKGVTVCGDAGDATRAIRALFAAEPGARVVVEERLTGREASVIAICDGTTAVALPAARDHKRLRDRDEGPNTGGMGAYSPLPDLADDEVDHLLETVHRPILAELARRGTPFRGFLYAGLMLTADGPVLLECNARLGDPEAQTILPRVAVALGPWLLAAAQGRLPAGAPTRLPVLPGATVAIVLAAAGYPAAPETDAPIEGLVPARDAGALVFHAGTRRDRDGTWRTRGGRVLAAVGRGPDLAAARLDAETVAERIGWAGMQRRRDIALDLPVPEPVA